MSALTNFRPPRSRAWKGVRGRPGDEAVLGWRAATLTIRRSPCIGLIESLAPPEVSPKYPDARRANALFLLRLTQTNAADLDLYGTAVFAVRTGQFPPRPTSNPGKAA